MMGYAVEFENNMPVRMRWTGPDKPLAVERCPRSWPHEAHGPWYPAVVWRPGDCEPGMFDCPGVPFPLKAGES